MAQAQTQTIIHDNDTAADDDNIMRVRPRRRRRRASQPMIPCCFRRLSREYLLVLLVLASNQRNGGVSVATEAPTFSPLIETFVPTSQGSLEVTLDSSFLATSGDTEVSEETTSPSPAPTISQTSSSPKPLHIVTAAPKNGPTEPPKTDLPSRRPSYEPTMVPTESTTLIPTAQDTFEATIHATTSGPSEEDISAAPTEDADTRQDTIGPEVPIDVPTLYPTEFQMTSDQPDSISSVTSSPTAAETTTMMPTFNTSLVGTPSPTARPTLYPKTKLPTSNPSNDVTLAPTVMDSNNRQDTPSPAGGVPIETSIPTVMDTSNSTNNNPNSTETPSTESPTVAPTTVETTSEPTGSPTAQSTSTDAPTNPPTASPTTSDVNPIPVPMETSDPTNSPSVNPIPPPTVPPSSGPTRRPLTYRPTTDAPTVAPTNAATPRPSAEPTRGPTASPTSQPTETASEAPTSAPSFPPSPNPTSSPSAYPTMQPVVGPTPLPTPHPTDSPSYNPTGSPSEEPSTAPSVSTRSPTTMVPSTSPSVFPSLPPTVSSAPTTKTPRPTISSLPSFHPSVSPTGLPSVSPTDLPSVYPSFAPSSLPSEPPSQAPSLSLQNEGERVVMTMRYADILEGLSIITWEQITATHIRQSIVSAGVDPPMEDLRVWTNIIRQTPEASSNAATPVPATATAIQAEPSNRRQLLRRGLQQQTTTQAPAAGDGPIPLKIAFDTAISYRSEKRDHNIQALIASAFNTEEDREEYVNSLKRTNDGAFQDLSEVVAVSVGGVYIPEEETDKNKGGEVETRDMTVFIIIGAVAGGGALVLLVLFFLWRHYMSKKPGSMGKTDAVTNNNASNANGVTTEIVVEHNPDEVSTLGDPVYTPNGMMGMMTNTIERDERTASVADDYDYKYLKHHNFGTTEAPRDRVMSEGDRSRLRADDNRSRLHSEESMTRESSGKTGSQSKLGFSQMGESIFSDDASFEEQYIESDQQVPFEITAPAGKLGMVIDTPNGGFPIVHAIKDTSILADRVRVGDRLVSVDGQDCTTMTAVQVSKLISLKSEQESRVLVFVRNRAPRPGTPD